jgi:septation ring formation regulator EzrA
MDKVSRKIGILKEKIKNVSAKMFELHKENKKLTETNEDLLTKVRISEEENKMARKFVKERDIVKSRIKNILENIERAKI